MAHLILLPDGEYFAPYCFEDALEAVEQYAGRDLREFIEEYMQGNVDDAGAAWLEAEKSKKDMEMDSDHYRKVLLAIDDGLDALNEMLNANCLDRTELRKLVATLSRTVNDEL